MFSSERLSSKEGRENAIHVFVESDLAVREKILSIPDCKELIKMDETMGRYTLVESFLMRGLDQEKRKRHERALLMLTKTPDELQVI